MGCYLTISQMDFHDVTRCKWKTIDSMTSSRSSAASRLPIERREHRMKSLAAAITTSSSRGSTTLLMEKMKKKGASPSMRHSGRAASRFRPLMTRSEKATCDYGRALT